MRIAMFVFINFSLKKYFNLNKFELKKPQKILKSIFKYFKGFNTFM